ncbi:metal-sensitive transcriptional regulator [Candidatus Formimonas warabiya]|uniref:Transcriptional regulator n=1 Tax=Formimonas warabiya TaxID=1761012 RepID=A0A3G1KND6_FORW1|nr:metal-sensitive transcriptional regulator [Candidatus Formimonas warabiya]ATW23968.1 transcriptional regulator [Candidatus Formimonas warabiya]
MAECEKEDVIQRLKKIEGQVKGIQRMIEDNKYCVDILIQIAAVRAAINKVGIKVLENHTRECLKTAFQNKREEEMIEELIDVVVKFTK